MWPPLPRPSGAPCKPQAVSRQPLPCDARERRFLQPRAKHVHLEPCPPPASSPVRPTRSRRRGGPRRRPAWTARVDGPLSLSPQPAEGIGQGPEAVRGDLGLGPDQPERLHGVLVVRDLRAAEGRRRRLVRPASRGAPGPGAAPQAGVERGVLVLLKVECQAGSPRGGGPPRSSYRKENKRTSCQCLKNSDISQNV